MFGGAARRIVGSMKLLRFAAIFFLMFLSACLTGSGRLETRSFDLADFDSIEVDEGIHLDVARDPAFSVSITADDNLWDALDVSRQGTTLRIQLRSDTIYSSVTVHAMVSMPVLASLHASGGAHASFSGFDEPSSNVALHASGASEIAGDANVESFDVHVSGGSHATLTGAAATVQIDGSGGSNADLGGLETSAADVSLSGGSGGSITVDHGLDYHLSGASHLVYFGAPQIGKSETSGGSTAEHH